MRTRKEIETANKIFDKIIARLLDKGLRHIEIPRLVKDLINILKDNKSITLAAINNDIELLGWPQNLVDQSLFDELIYLIEIERSYNIINISGLSF